jgi:hypothetical protein
MNYMRVIPRDLFNEAKLLKCLGQISLLVHDGKIQGLSIEHEHEMSGFVIEQNGDDGSIYVTNLHFFDDQGEPVEFHHPLNAKGNYPMIMTYKGEEYYPLNEKGQFQCDTEIFLRGQP